MNKLAEAVPSIDLTSTLRITEIFHSLQGEARDVGRPTVFVRLTGCPLRCGYCDTEYAFHGGDMRVLQDILGEVAAFRCPVVTVTGGEPLAQPNALPLMRALCDMGMAVSIETSGALDISAIDPRVSRVMDLKTPASGEVHRNRYDNVQHLTKHDQVKFVICDHADYDWARAQLSQHDLAARVGDVLFSPAFGQVQPVDLAAWILADALPVRFQMQLHKLLWGDEPGR